MRSIALSLELAVLLPIAFVRPFVGVLLWSWISFMNPHRLVYGGVALTIPWAMLIFFATIFGCLAAREPKRLPINAVTVQIGLFLIMITFTMLFALAPFDVVEAKWELTFKVFLFLLITAGLLNSKERVHALVWVMALSLGFFGIRGGGFTLIGGGADKVYGPDQSMIRDNNHLAVALLVAMPLMNYLRLESRHAIIRYGWLVTILLSLFAVVGSWSRGALLALGAVVGYFWLRSSKKLISGILMVIVVLTAIVFMPEKWAERMHTIQEYQQDDSAMARLEIWRVAWLMATSRPLTGGGFMATYVQGVVDQFAPGVGWRAVHSIWFEILAEHGFPTFFVWVGISIAGAIYTRRIIRLAKDVAELEWCVNLARMAQVSMIAYIVGGTFLSLCYWDYYFTILVMVAAVYQHVAETVRGTTQQARLRPTPLPARLALSR